MNMNKDSCTGASFSALMTCLSHQLSSSFIIAVHWSLLEAGPATYFNSSVELCVNARRWYDTHTKLSSLTHKCLEEAYPMMMNGKKYIALSVTFISSTQLFLFFLLLFFSSSSFFFFFIFLLVFIALLLYNRLYPQRYSTNVWNTMLGVLSQLHRI